MYSYRKKVKNPNYFKKDEIFNDYITNYNRKFDLYLVKCEFEVEFINYSDSIKTECFFNTFIVNMKNYLIHHIYHVISRGRKFSQISKMKIATLSNMSCMNFKYYLKQPMQMIERRLKKVIAKNPQLIIWLNRDSNHPLIRKFIHISFNN